MKLPADVHLRILVLALTAALAGCGFGSQGDRPAQIAAPLAAQTGPAADYPMVLGAPFTVDGVVYTPSDAMNYDAVGYAALDPDGGAAVTVEHRTLPLPSYVEVTSLDSGKTILARAERRGPMTGSRLVGLSPSAAAQLGVGEGAAVRVRRVNPPEADRAELRAGRTAPERMDTPKPLLEVLRRKLPGSGFASLGAPASRIAPVAAPSPASAAQPVARSVTAQPAVQPRITPAPIGTASPAAATSTVTQPSAPAAKGSWAVQVATFASKDNAHNAAGKLHGSVTPAGKYYRVRTGPFATRGQAEAALAKVRAAGYSDARLTTAD